MGVDKLRRRMKYFSEEDRKKIEEEISDFNLRYLEVTYKIQMVLSELKEEKSKEYLLHGAMRRIRLLRRCVENIFIIYPHEREELLSENERDDLMINLHAFLINVFGILDNLAWVWLVEKGLAINMNSADVGLFNRKTQKNFIQDFQDYLNSETMQKWHFSHLKNYRDALSHRIAPYIPPRVLSAEQRNEIARIEKELEIAREKNDFRTMNRLEEEEEKIGEVCPFFQHSLYGPVSRSQVKRAKLTWEDISKKLVDNGWAKFESVDVVSLMVNVTKEKENIAKVFGDDFLKILPILQDAYCMVSLHAQVIADFKTIEEIIEKYYEMF